MRKALLFIPALLIFSIFYLVGYQSPVRQQESYQVTNLVSEKAFAVVELFTSQGCSSCPPADNVLSNIIDDAAQSNTPVYALSFHVDYWNYLGWKDPYSDASYSARQRQYDQILGARVYTPQMIVNGQHVFVGSNDQEAKHWIEQSLEEKDQYELELFSTFVEGEKQLTVSYQTLAPKGKLLNIALAQKSAFDQVKRGENRGEKLNHSHVVRSFSQYQIGSNQSEVSIEIPESLKIEDLILIGYIQDKNTMKIEGADQITPGK